MDNVQSGDVVKIHYTGKLINGNVIETSKNHQPLEFTVGNGQVLAGIDKSVIGMKAGEQRSVEIVPEEAFGLRRDDLVVVFNKADMPDHIHPSIGQQLKFDHPDFKDLVFSVMDMDEQTVTLDANHPLAGHTLYFDLELVEIK
jgi:peptidylprolyl isomerase